MSTRGRTRYVAPSTSAHDWTPAFIVSMLVFVTAVAVGLLLSTPANVGWAVAVGLPATVLVIFVLVMYIFLTPFQCEVSFTRGHAFFKASGIHSSGFRSSYVKPQRAVQRGLVVDVRNNIRGFRITFQNESDAALFVGWCEESGVPTVLAT